ncbi:AMP-binding protein [Chelatococcus reniformis]|uniref:3-methylmercaptopropionyl-CoA ligase n=1 Tax=Chelatococcus reniformis TaxID=1494448 RepID=A0A916TWZ0_9HYPH|nr:AMP-binding protein [Chelatococcus reniformis]GGC48567.1 long-chain-fatty-acid--CoA ligase [Chelatococcus reniformis]
MTTDRGMNVANSVECGPRDGICLYFEGEAISYATVAETAARLRRLLADAGVARGDHVALAMSNSPAFVVAYLAILGLGCVAVCISPALAADEIDFILDDSGCKAAFADANLDERFARRGIRRLEVDAPVAGHPPLPTVGVGPDHPAVIVYSSGTTGRPKGVVLSHGNVDFTARSKVRYMGVRPDDRLLLFLPLHHCFGQNAIMNAAFCAGASVVLQRRFDREAVIGSLRADGVTMVFGVPTTFLSLEEHLTDLDIAGVRYWFSAAAPLPLEVEQRWAKRMGRPIYQGYGQTECSPFATYNHLIAIREGCVGTPIEQVELRVVDPQDDRDVAPGEAGEILLRGPNVMSGYWNRAEETARALRGGWLHTGDIGRLDADGYLSIEDRLTDLIIVGGRNVYPAEVENVLYGHPGVAEAAVFGVPDPFLGEEVWATVVLHPSHPQAPEELEALCRASIAAYKVPSVIAFADRLPRNPTGKILKRELRAAAHRPVARPVTTAPTAAETQAWVARWLERRLNLGAGTVEGGRSFAEYGLDSILGVALARELGDHLRCGLEPTLVWETATLAALVQHLTAIGAVERDRATPVAA